jgi:thymidylate synthase ThyX
MWGSPHADTEIRMLSVEICRVLKNESPNIFPDIEIYDEADGLRAVRFTYSKA